jgi:hypothetical protein
MASKKKRSPRAMRAIAEVHHEALEFNRLRPVGNAVWYRGGYHTVRKPATVVKGRAIVLIGDIAKPVLVSQVSLNEPRLAVQKHEADSLYELIDDLEREVRKNIAETKALRELVDTRHITYEKSHTEYFTAITNFSDEHNKRCTNIENSFGSLEEKVEQFIRKLEPSNRVEAQEHLLQLLLKVLEKLVED